MADLATFSMFANLGLEIADRALALYAQQVGQERKDLRASLQDLVNDSEVRLRAAIKDSADRIIDKLEGDKLEQLHTRIANVGMLLRMKKQDALLQSALTLNESVEYAKNRLAEEKWSWLGPWLAGKSVFLAAMTECDATEPEAYAEFRREVTRAKHLVLDTIVPGLLHASPNLPWEKITLFLTGQPSSLLLDAADAAILTTRYKGMCKGMCGRCGHWTYQRGANPPECELCRSPLTSWYRV